MNKYIDADLLISKELIPLTKRLDCCHPKQMKGVLMAMGKIDSAPAADVVEVVRCKDCKHKGWVQEPWHGKSADYCRIWDSLLPNLETTFCSYGERDKSNDM